MVAGERWFNCATCGTVFGMWDREIESYSRRGLQVPNHCAPCRTARNLIRLAGEVRRVCPCGDPWLSGPIERLTSHAAGEPDHVLCHRCRKGRPACSGCGSRGHDHAACTVAPLDAVP